jgi:hypothetical protein
MTHYYNKKIGFYKKYYDSVFFEYILRYSNTTGQLLSKNTFYKSNSISSCLVIYPVFYKRLSFFNFSAYILKKKRMKNRYNLNQTIILEGTISKTKCVYSIPLLSIDNKVLF